MSDIADEDAACVRSILTGRPEQFRELVNRYQDSVFAILSRYERDRGLVEDMAQAVFLKAWRHLKKFDPLKAPFENWLSRMATNTALNHVRDEKHFRDQVPISQLNEGALEWLQQEDESSPLESMEAREILNRCMVGLSPDDTTWGRIPENVQWLSRSRVIFEILNLFINC